MPPAKVRYNFTLLTDNFFCSIALPEQILEITDSYENFINPSFNAD